MDKITNRPAIVIRRTVNPGQTVDRKATPGWAKKMGKLEYQVTTSEAEKVEDWVWELTYGASNEPYIFASVDYLLKQLSKPGARVVAVLNKDNFPKGLSQDVMQRLGMLINQAEMLAVSFQMEQQATKKLEEATELLNATKSRKQNASAREVRASA